MAALAEFAVKWDDAAVSAWCDLMRGEGKIAELYWDVLEWLTNKYGIEGFAYWGSNHTVRKFCEANGLLSVAMELGPTRSPFFETRYCDFMGVNGDAMTRGTGTYEDTLRAVNLIMPYVVPRFLADRDLADIASFSMTCLQNARDIFLALEDAYQDIYQKKMTVRRIPEAIRFSRLPDVGACLDYDLTLAPSEYIRTDIERLERLTSYQSARAERLQKRMKD
jgi:hypothetical protein